jgi:DNA-directed RNA polymerase specialized sigma24 family protein
MTSAGSVTNLIGRLKDGDEAAASRLWELFSARLLEFAREHLRDDILPIADEEDVVVSALGSFFSGAERGEFTLLSDREKLWNLLAVITKRKVFDHLNRENRLKRRPNQPADQMIGADRFNSDESGSAIDMVLDPALSPDIQAVAKEACQKLLEVLGDSQLRSIAVLKLEGYTKIEIAGMLGCAVRTVERKLRLIRTIWCQTSNV